MKKIQYRYKCMICGTEEISEKDVLSCSACGSDELAKFEYIPIVEQKEPKPAPKKHRRKKAEPVKQPSTEKDLLDEKDLKSILITLHRYCEPDALTATSMASSSASAPVSTSPTASRTLTKREKFLKFVKSVKWKTVLKRFMPIAIGTAIYWILKIFI